MSKTETKLPGPIAAITPKALLGLTDPADGDWARLRGLQYAQLFKRSLLPLFMQMLAGCLAIYATLGIVAVPALIAWGGALMAATGLQLRINHQLNNSDVRRINRAEFKQHSITAAVTGLIWGAAFLYAGSHDQLSGDLTIWTAALTVIVAYSLLLSVAPLGTILMIVIMGATAATGFSLSGHFAFALQALLVTGIAVIGVLESARNNVVAKLSEAGSAEKDEVVSLLLREFEENEADWLWQIDTGRRVRSVSPRFAFALGRTQADIEGQPLLKMISGDSWETGQFPASLHDLAERLKHRESFSNLIVKVQIGDRQRWWELSGTPILDESGNNAGFRGVGSDVTTQRESSEKIAYLARYDALTGLPNRLMLNEALSDARKYAEQWRTSCAFLMIDLDRFKAVNDSLGHQIGDELLAEVSKRLSELMGKTETCGRLGGDEFAVVIRDVRGREDVERMAKAIIARLSEPYEVKQHTLYVGASVGSAIFPRDGRSAEDLMRNADLALYGAKDEGGGDHYPYKQSLHDAAEERRQLEFSLRHAIERDELVLHYQPVVDANRETIVSFEALVRWQSRDHGFVSPGKFIPIAEDTRLIVPIGTWVMNQACRQASNWPANIKVNVNVSPEQLLEPDFVDVVVLALNSSGLDPQRLEIEVTESIFVRDAGIAGAALERVMALGCSVALDDFGTGYSSLGYLRQLKFSTIKVDRSFVTGAAQGSRESIAIIRAVVAMAESMDMTTTAEGVETAEEAEMICGMGCDKIQGFYFGRPMPAAEAQALFSASRELRA